MCIECSAPATVEIRPAERLDEFLWSFACDEHVGTVLTWMRLAGWRRATVTALADPLRAGQR